MSPRRLGLCIALLLVGGAGAHGVAGDPNEAPGVNDGGLDGLTLKGPAGTPVESGPCVDAAAAAPANSPHIGHIYAVLAPGDVHIAPGSVNLFHFVDYEDPEGVEGPDDDSASIMTGTDGFFRGRFTETLFDTSGFDLTMIDFHEYASYCAWGAREEDGPFLFLGSAFPAGDFQTPMDMKYFYADLHEEEYPGEKVQLEYLLVQGSVDKYPAIDAGFTRIPGGDFGHELGVDFFDASSRYGWPTRPSVFANDPDPIEIWEWWIDTDPTTASDIDLTAAPDYTFTMASTDKGPKSIDFDPGDFQVCLRVTAIDGTGPPLSGDVTTDIECEILKALNKAPKPSIAWAKGVGPFEIDFTPNAKDPEGDCIGSYLWNFNGEGTSTLATPSFTFDDWGIKKVTLAVADCWGAWSSPVLVHVDIQNLPPWISAVADTTVVQGQIVQHQVTYGDPEGYPVTFTAKVPPGAIIGPVGTNTHGFYFDTTNVPPGSYAVAYEVADDLNSAREEATIHVFVQAPDFDRDGHPDVRDTCPAWANHEQGTCVAIPEPVLEERQAAAAEEEAEMATLRIDRCDLGGDLDEDGAMDLCDVDADGDGVPQAGHGILDNCPTVSNADQLDRDGDGIGDACDATPVHHDHASTHSFCNGCKAKGPGPILALAAFVGVLAGVLVMTLLRKR